MNRIIKITEEAYKYYVNGEDVLKYQRKSIIDEALHYPEFLDKVKSEVEMIVCNYVSDMVDLYKGSFETNFTTSYNLYFKTININIALNYGEDISDKALYSGFSNSNEALTEDNKLDMAYLTFIFPVSDEGKYDASKIRYVVSHEVGHLYDDWNDLIRGGEGLFINKKTSSNAIFMKDNYKSDSQLLRNIAWLCYFSNYTEGNSYTNQLKQELKGLNAHHSNVKEKFKETLSYNNLKKTEIGFFDGLDKSNDVELFNLNLFILKNYRDASVPKLNSNQFNAEKYRKMLSKWAERLIHKIAKRYYGVVQLYYDELNEEWSKKTCIFVHE